jgi:hypothetical protein
MLRKGGNDPGFALLNRSHELCRAGRSRPFAGNTHDQGAILKKYFEDEQEHIALHYESNIERHEMSHMGDFTTVTLLRTSV